MAKYNKRTVDGVEYFRTTFTLGGKKYDLSAKTEAELDAKVYQAKRDFELGTEINSPNVTVGTWAKKWLEVYKKNDVVSKSYKLYETNLNIYILSEIGSVKMREVKKYQLQQILNTESGKSKSHVNHVKCAITGMFASAIENGIISANPAKGLKIPITATAGTHRPITSLESLYLFLVCGYHYMGLWPLLMFYCGLRPVECCGLLWSDVDLKKKLIHVRRATTKTAAGERSVPITDDFLPRLVKDKREGHVLMSQSGKICTTRYLENCWYNICRHMDIAMGTPLENNALVGTQIADDFTPYCLRHTYCTNLQRAGVPLNVAKYLMGHHDIRMTAQIYGHQTDDQTEAARKLLNNLTKIH